VLYETVVLFQLNGRNKTNLKYADDAVLAYKKGKKLRKILDKVNET
jgi:hypothetical protein